MRRVVFVGNCQAHALMDAFNLFVAPFTGERALHVAAYHDLDEASRAVLESADVIVDLVFDFAQRINLADLGLDKPVVTVPYVNCNFLWPYAYEEHPRNERRYASGWVPYPAQLGDAYLNRLMREEVPAEDAAARYFDLDINQKVRLDRGFEINLALQKQRDEKTGFAVADLMERHFREEPIFLTPDHPNRRIFLHVAERCFTLLGVPSHLVARLPHLMRRSLFLQERLPLHTRLAAHFGLVWAGEETRYPFWLDGDFTFAEFVTRYLRFEYCEDFALGHHLASQGQRGEAIARLRAGLAAHPAADRAWLLLSHVYTAEGALPGALVAAREAVSRNPREAEYFAHLGNLLTNAGEVAAPRAAYERAVALEPEHTPWLRLLAGYWERQGKRAEAGALVAALAQVDPLDYELHVQRGHLLAGRGDAAGAVSAFSHALGLAPHIAGVRAARSHVLTGLGRLPEAIADARAALAETPEDDDLRRHLGSLLIAGGDNSGAVETFRTTLAADPENAELRNRLDFALARGKADQTATSFAGAEKQREGEAFFHAGKFVEAEAAQTKLPSSFPMIFFENALVSYNKNDRSISVEEQNSASTQSTSEISFVIKDKMIGHYFHFMEILISLYCTWSEIFHDKSVKNIIFEHNLWDIENEKKNILHKTIILALFGEVNLIQSDNLKNMTIRNCAVIDRSISVSSINKFCEFILGFAWKFAPKMKTKILSSLDLNCNQNKKESKIVYVKRDPPRQLTPELEEQLLQILTGLGKIEIVDFTGKTIQDQMIISISADIMIGVHGNGLTNAFWLPPHATLIEIFPLGVHHYDYQLFCEILGIRYFGLEGELICRDFSRFGPPYGHDPHHNVPVEMLNMSEIKSIIERILSYN